jgi:asparagine synthetase B (glutamine-hydrolysing)
MQKALDLIHHPFQYGLDEKTPSADVKKVKPGCYAEWDYRSNQEPNVTTYWNIDFTADFNHTEKYFIDKTRELIEEAVLLSPTGIDSPGIFLSGGLDSRTGGLKKFKNMNQAVTEHKTRKLNYHWA